MILKVGNFEEKLFVKSIFKSTGLQAQSRKSYKKNSYPKSGVEVKIG